MRKFFFFLAWHSHFKLDFAKWPLLSTVRTLNVRPTTAIANNLLFLLWKDIEAAAAMALLPLLLKEKKGKDEVFLKIVSVSFH